MASLKQTDRLMQFSSLAGKDALLIESLDGEEAISRLFEYHVDLLATPDTEIDPKSLVGTKATVAIGLNDVAGTRWINGIITSFEECAGDADFNVFRARIVPSMWQLTLSTNCRVFQSKTVVDIVKAVIGDYGLSVSDQTTTSYKPLDYCTQYSESDFHFVSRIMEESGIFYWFEHTDQDNKIVLGDARTVYPDCPLSASIVYALNEKGAEGGYGAWVSEFTSTATMVSGKHSTADYNFRTYTRVDADPQNSSSPYGKNAYEQYLYPAGEEGYIKDATTQLVKQFEDLFLDSRAQASDATSEIYRGRANARSFCAGYAFTLSKSPRTEWNQKYLLTVVSHHAEQVPPYRTTGTGQRGGYSNRFTAIPTSVTFKPAQTFMKPKIYGPQTAKVVVSQGEDIWLDKYGRINVQFMWDKVRQNKPDNTWVRVAQQWAGNGWGTYFWPRVNDEVVVVFLDGDPDNPLVVGSVYNGVNMPKYPLPDNSTRSGLVTRSSKGGSAQNANELRFEDKTGSEQVYLHAEKDMDVSVEHDRRISVGNNDSLIVTGVQSEQIGSNFNRQIKSNAVEQIGGNSDLGISGNLTEQVGGNHSLNISSNESVQVGSAYSMNANNTVYINAGMSVVIQAGMELCLQGSGGFITIGPAGIAISGTMVMINSGGAPVSGSPGTISSPGTPAAPDKADDGQGGGSSSSASPAASPGASAPHSSASALGGAVGAAGGAAGQAEQVVQQATQQAVNQAQQAASQAQQAAQQAEQQAQQGVDQVTQEARQAFQQANQAVQQAQQTVSQAAAQGQAAAQQALSQAQQQTQQCAQAAAQAVQQAQQEAQQVQQQAQQAAAQAKQAAQQAQQQAQQAVQQGQQAAQQAQQQAQQAAQQAQQQAQQAAAQAQQAAKQAQQQAQQAQQQVKQAASQAQQQAQQASQAAQQSASQAISQAQRGF
jgi:type VI secretion system secreted protein VgrG